MNFMQRLGYAFDFVRNGEQSSRGRLVRGIAEQQGPVWPRLDVYKEQAEEYARSAWVYVAVTRIVEAASLVPLGVYSTNGAKPILIPNHPIEKLLRNPNPVTSQFELMEQTYGFLELNGNAYWFLAGDRQPEEIWTLRPDRVQVVPDADDYVGGYIYRLDAGEFFLAKEEVIHFKRWHPFNDYYGLSAMEAAALASASDRAMELYNRNFFGPERGVPAGMVHVRGNIPDADFERIKREFTESYSGTNRRTAFTRGLADSVIWSDMGLSQRDMDFMQGRAFTKDEIMAIYGVPLSMYSTASTQAVAEVARRVFLEDTLWPKLVRVAQKATQQLAPFYGKDLVIQPEEIRDTTPDIQELVAARGDLTLNERRARFWHLDAVPGGDRVGDLIDSPTGDPQPLANQMGEQSEGTL